MSINNLKYAIYARKSSEDDKKQIQSIDDQLRFAKELALREELKVVKTFTDIKTGTKPGIRKGFYEMVDAIENGEVDGIICWKLDRLARNPVDAGTAIYALQRNKIQHIITSDRRFTPLDSQILINIDFGAASQYSIDLSKNVKRGIKTKLEEKGQFIALAPMGYLNAGTKKGEKYISIDPERFHILKECWNKFATGSFSVMDIKRYAESQGLSSKPNKKTPQGHKVAINSYYAMFRNPFYKGLMLIKEELYKGSHQPMITPRLFDDVQKELRKRAGKATQSPGTKEFLYPGIVKCGECGSSMISEDKIRYVCNCCNKKISTSKGIPEYCPSCKEKMSDDVYNNAKYYSFMYCVSNKKKNIEKKCHQLEYQNGRKKVSVPIKDIDEQVEASISSVYIPEMITELCYDILNKLSSDFKFNNKKQVDSRKKDIARIETSLNNLIDLRLTDSIDTKEFEKKKLELENQKITLKHELDENFLNKGELFSQAKKTLEVSKQAKKFWNEGGIKEKKELLGLMYSHKEIKKGKFFGKMRKPFCILAKQGIQKERRTQKNTPKGVLCSIWLP